ncbi:MAG: DUF4390 domain-containing protein [Gammaproteobacteria bacterium]|nr:DUF4390 domain-containing protein [Gammaproteobacteria bacterium]
MHASVIARINAFFLFLLFSVVVHADTFKVSSAQISKIGNGYVLNAKIEYPLTARVLEAIDNGVPITFEQQFELIESIPLLGGYWQWNETLWSTNIHHELRYHALSQQYVLHALDTDNQRNFPSLISALHALGKIEGFSLPPEHLDDIDNLVFQLRSGIDLHALPTPMRPGALISSKWQLTSPWVEAQWD